MELERSCKEECEKLPKNRCAKVVAPYSKRLEVVIGGKEMGANELVEVKVETLLERPEPSTDNHGLHDICKDTDHRKLAICSIICGLSCFGIMSLMYSVKAREMRKRLPNEDCQETRDKVQKYSKKACKWGIVSIVAWIVLILIFPLLLGFLSYIVTFID